MTRKTVVIFTAGYLTGAGIMMLGAEHVYRQMKADISKERERNKAAWHHMLDTMVPYVPVEVLKDNVEFMTFQNIIAEEFD